MFHSYIPLFFQITKKKEHFLWQLFNIENDVEKANEEIDAEKRSLQEIMSELDGYNDESRKKEKELAKYKKEIDKREKKISEKKYKIDKNVSPYFLFKSV